MSCAHPLRLALALNALAVLNTSHPTLWWGRIHVGTAVRTTATSRRRDSAAGDHDVVTWKSGTLPAQRRDQVCGRRTIRLYRVLPHDRGRTVPPRSAGPVRPAAVPAVLGRHATRDHRRRDVAPALREARPDNPAVAVDVMFPARQLLAGDHLRQGRRRLGTAGLPALGRVEAPDADADIAAVEPERVAVYHAGDAAGEGALLVGYGPLR